MQNGQDAQRLAVSLYGDTVRAKPFVPYSVVAASAPGILSIKS